MENKCDLRLMVLAVLFLLAITVYLLRAKVEFLELMETSVETEFEKSTCRFQSFEIHIILTLKTV
jgi:hypothetical protein